MSTHPEHLDRFVAHLTAAQSALYGCIRTLMAGAPEAADVLQETNRVLWQKAADYDHARPFLAWAYGIARFQVLAYRRRQSRDRLVFDEELVAQLADEYERQSGTESGELRALEHCLQKLPGAQRELVRAKYERGEAVNLIAAQTGKPVNAVSAALYRVRHALADCMARRLAPEGPR
ncbi:MAG: sigma-70 family RNA polymerase sigma factor [Verrucomicrobia bacterium]|nr:sigma-70 family RNA polymerase sigma factor [Verrucomicrobiota bacterium]